MPVFGLPLIKKRLRVITRNVRREVAQALDDASDDLLFRARGLAPQLDSDLIESGSILRRGNRSVVTRVVYFDSPYAVVRHEDFYNLGPVSSLKQSPDGEIGRKYLSRPFEAQQPTYQRDIGAAVRRGLRSAVR